MDDKLEFHWNDIHQLDKMFSMTTQAVNTAVQNSSHDDDNNNPHLTNLNIHSNNSNSNTPVDHQMGGHIDHNIVDSPSNKIIMTNTLAATTNILKSSVINSSNTVSGSSIIDTETPSSTSNNDYMLFLNLTTPNSGIDDHIKKVDITNDSHDLQIKKDDENSNSAFNFDSIDTSNLDFIMDQRNTSVTPTDTPRTNHTES
ncbi:hypothetical protein C6P42_002406, partial [Pichia californica]